MRASGEGCGRWASAGAPISISAPATWSAHGLIPFSSLLCACLVCSVCLSYSKNPGTYRPSAKSLVIQQRVTALCAVDYHISVIHNGQTRSQRSLSPRARRCGSDRRGIRLCSRSRQRRRLTSPLSLAAMLTSVLPCGSAVRLCVQTRETARRPTSLPRMQPQRTTEWPRPPMQWPLPTAASSTVPGQSRHAACAGAAVSLPTHWLTVPACSLRSLCVLQLSS